MKNLAGLQDKPATTSELFATILLSKNISKDINELYGSSFQEMEKHHSSKSLFEIAKEIPKKSGPKLS